MVSMRDKRFIALLGILAGIPLGYVLKGYEPVELPPRIESIKKENVLLKELVKTLQDERKEIKKTLNQGQTP